jgi:hypothetical protein
MLWYILLQVDPPSASASRGSLLFMWINTHALSNAALNISPFFAGAVHASPNAHDAFFFSFTEIVYQTHCISSFLCCFVVTARLKRFQESCTLTGSPSVAKANVFKSYSAGINACSTPLQDTATLELL